MSHSYVAVEGNNWTEPMLLWIAICMPTGSGNSAVCKFLRSLVDEAHQECDLGDDDPSWCLDYR